MDLTYIKDLLTEQGETFNKFASQHEGRLDALERSLREEKAEREDLELRMGRPGASAGARGPLAQVKGAEALGQFVRHDIKTMSVGSDPDGGYTVPAVVDYGMIELLRNLSPLRQLAEVVQTTTSDWSRLVNTQGLTVTRRAEMQAPPTTSTPGFGMFRPTIGEMMTEPVVSTWLIEDAGFDIGAHVMNEAAQVFAVTESDDFIRGDSIEKAEGILSRPTVATGDATRAWGTVEHVVTGQAATFATTDPIDNLIDLMYKLHRFYRSRPNTGWLMNSNTAAVIRKWKDADKQLIWQPSVIAGQPDMLLGYPVWIDDFMDDVGANKYPVAFGCWSEAYLIVDRVGTKLIRDDITSKGFSKFFMRRRVGGGVKNTQAYKLLKCST